MEGSTVLRAVVSWTLSNRYFVPPVSVLVVISADVNTHNNYINLPAWRLTQGEMESSREKKKVLTAQARKLNNELRACLRRKETAESQQSELKEAINEHEVECKVSETDVRCFGGKQATVL